MIERSKPLCKERGAEEGVRDLGCYSQPRLRWEQSLTKDFVTNQRECLGPYSRNSQLFKHGVPLLKGHSVPVKPRWDFLPPLLLYPYLLISRRKKNLKSWRMPTHRNIKRTGNWFAEWVFRSDWEVILVIERKQIQKNEGSRGKNMEDRTKS